MSAKKITFRSLNLHLSLFLRGQINPRDGIVNVRSVDMLFWRLSPQTTTRFVVIGFNCVTKLTTTGWVVQGGQFSESFDLTSFPDVGFLR